jgi:hypothetical protein
MQFAISGQVLILELPRFEALDLLEWLGLGRPEFGAIAVSELLPLCRRRLWPEPRNEGRLKAWVWSLANALQGARDAVLCFG